MDEYSWPMQWYVSRRVALPLPVAAAALDRLTRLGSGRATLGRLRLTDVHGPLLPTGVRRLHGRLSLGDLGRPVRVELELTGWSCHEAELGLRARKPVSSIRAARYGTTAALTLEEVRSELMVRRSAPQLIEPPLRRAS